MATCRKCRASIAPDSPACPRCGIARPIVPRWVRLFTGISLGLFVATFVLVGVAKQVNAPRRSRPAPPAPAADESVKARAVTAGELLAAYRSNEVAADERYRDQWLGVSGEVAAVRKDALGAAAIDFRGGQVDGTVTAYLRDEAATIARAGQLVPGEPTLLLCKGNGMVLGAPMVRDCIFLKDQPAR